MPSDQDSFELAIALQALAARQAVLGIALREILSSLSPEHAEACATRIRGNVARFVANQPVTLIPQADEAVAQELALMLGTLMR